MEGFVKRIKYDVSKWSIFLHRQARGLPQADLSDSSENKLQDELFDRLYAGDSAELPPEDQDPKLKEWADKLHGVASALPDFERLAHDCVGDDMASAVAVEKIMGELTPIINAENSKRVEDAKLRKAFNAGMSKASTEIEMLDDLAEATEGIAFGRKPGTGSGKGGPMDQGSPRRIAERIKNDARLKRILLLAGKFKRIAQRKQREKVKHGRDEITDIESGSDISRLLPMELSSLAHPKRKLLLFKNLLENSALQYKLEGTEDLGKGPIVVCLDKSGSMQGAPDEWATAVALALLEVARMQKRPFALLPFDALVKEEFVVPAGGELPEIALFTSCVGGTNIGRVLMRGLKIIETNYGNVKMKKADIVLITDGQSDTFEAHAFRELAKTMQVTTLGFGIGVAPEDMKPWCDEVHTIRDLDGMDDATATKMFAQV